MAIQPKAYDIIGEWSPELASRVDESFQILFNNLLAGTFDVAPGQLTSLIPVPQGGTGLASYAIGDLLYASAVTTLAGLPIGAAGKLVRSTGTLPAYSTFTIPNTFATGDLIYGSAANVLTALADVAVGSYLRSGGVATAPVWSTATLPNTATTGDLLYASATSVYSNLPAVAAGKVLRAAGAATAPAYSTFTIPDTFAAGDVIYASAANVLVALAKDANATRYLSNTGAANIPAWAQVNLANGVSGVLPVANGGTATSTAFTTGSVIFSASGVYSENNAKVFWDNTNFRLGLGTAVPGGQLTLSNLQSIVWQDAINRNLTWLTHFSDTYLKLSSQGNGGDSATFEVDADGGAGRFRIRRSGGLKWGIENNDEAGTNTFAIKNSSDANALNIVGQGSTFTVNFPAANVGIGVASPTALLHFKAGTATANTAPLKFTSGTSLTTAEAGAIEFTTDDFFATITTGAARKAFILDNGARLTSGKVPIATTNGRLVDSTTALLLAASIPSIVGSTFEKAETGSDANVLTYTAGGADEALMVQVAIDISALTGTSVVVTVAWQDSNNASQTSVLTLTGVSDGTINIPINAKASANVVVSTVFVGVSTAYNISAFVVRLK